MCSVLISLVVRGEVVVLVVGRENLRNSIMSGTHKCGERGTKPFLETIQVGKDVGENKVEEGPQFR